MKVEITLDTDEELSIARLDLAVHRVAIDPVGIWNCDLILPVAQRNLYADALAKMGFVPAGNLTSGTVTSIRMRKSLRRSGDGWAALTNNGGLAATAQHPGHSHEELDALRGLSDKMAANYSPERTAANVAAIEASKRNPDEHFEVSPESIALAKAVLRRSS
jgi:hypothetical protein